MDIRLVLYILLLHTIADFVFQSRWMATNKSKNIRALSVHVLVYSIIVTGGISPFLGIEATGLFLFLTFVSHLITDFVTSRITTHFWQKQRMHEFFVTIGFDQWIHTMTLLTSFLCCVEFARHLTCLC